MSPVTREIENMLEMLPEEEQLFAFEFVKRLVLAWDPDFSKLTPAEKTALEQSEKSGFVSEDEIDWNNLDKYK